MTDFISDYGSGLFGLIITGFTAYLDYQQSNGPYKLINWKILTILFLGLCIFISSCVSTINSNREKEKLNGKITLLQQGIQSTSEKIKDIQTSQNKFEKVLLEKFKIIRDKSDNLPKRINNYNTTIGTAGTVNIGRE